MTSTRMIVMEKMMIKFLRIRMSRKKIIGIMII